MGIQCACGRFMSKAHPVVGYDAESYDGRIYVAEVRGDCSRCGADVAATGGWWSSWDAWNWGDDFN